MFCNKCGNKLSDSAAFCNKCGNKLGGVNTQSGKPVAGNVPNTKFLSYINRNDPLGSVIVLLKSLFHAETHSIPRHCNDATVLPALVFAATAVLAGVVLSAFLSVLFSSNLPYWLEVNAISLWRYAFLGGMVLVHEHGLMQM